MKTKPKPALRYDKDPDGMKNIFQGLFYLAAVLVGFPFLVVQVLAPWAGEVSNEMMKTANISLMQAAATAEPDVTIPAHFWNQFNDTTCDKYCGLALHEEVDLTVRSEKSGVTTVEHVTIPGLFVERSDKGLVSVKVLVEGAEVSVEDFLAETEGLNS